MGRTAKRIGKDNFTEQTSGLISKLFGVHCLSFWDSRGKEDHALLSPTKVPRRTCSNNGFSLELFSFSHRTSVFRTDLCQAVDAVAPGVTASDSVHSTVFIVTRWWKAAA